MEHVTERRVRTRVAVHWAIRLSRPENGRSIESTTEDVSSEGFYFLSDEPFQSGELLTWMLTVPSRMAGCSDLVLCGQARVARVDRAEAGKRFGIGCSIQDYTVVPVLPSRLERAEEYAVVVW
jgi:hypothetical protein